MEPFEIGYFDLPVFKPEDASHEIYEQDKKIPLDDADDGFLRFLFISEETWFIYIIPKPTHHPDADNNIHIAIKYFMYLNHIGWSDQWYIPMVMGTQVAFDGLMWRKYYVKHDNGTPYPDMEYRKFPKKWKVALVKGNVPPIMKSNYKIEVQSLSQYHDMIVPILKHFGNWLLFRQIPKEIEFKIYWIDEQGNLVLYPYEEEPLQKFKPHTYYIRENSIKWLGIKTENIHNAK